MAQLRIKELEEKVLSLEAERSEKNLDLIRIQARLDRAEKAALCVRKGWQFVGAGIAALSNIEGFDELAKNDGQNATGITGRRACSADDALLPLQPPSAHLRPSARISLDPNVLPGGVARNVARPPEADLGDVAEENSIEVDHSRHNGSAMMGGEETREELDEEDADSDHGEGDAISFSADGEDTIRLQTDVSNGAPLVPEQDSTQELARSRADDSLLAASAPPATTQASRYADVSNGNAHHQLHRMTSIDSLSSFADEEEIELSTDDEQSISALNRSTLTSLRAPSALSEPQSEDRCRSKEMRKRKTPNSPGDLRQAHSAASTPSKQEAQDWQSEGDSPQGSHLSRRSSMRDRKSVNYALPKLNTKMRKPDPVDLVPAERSEARRSEHTRSGSAAEDTSSADEDSRRRSLKGKHEVASTGNLREIRKRHQQRSAHQSAPEDERGNQQRMEEGGDRAGQHTTAQSPRRRSSRTSLRRRSSSSMQSENGQERPESRADDSDEDSDHEEEEKRDMENGRDEEYTLPGSQQQAELSNGARGTNVPLSTPRSRPQSSIGISSGSASNSHSLPSVTGTPIPKPTIRARPQGNIKALKVAGRMQKPAASSASGLPASSSQQSYPQQQRITSALSNGKRTTPSIGPSAKVLGNSSRANIGQRSVSTGLQPSTTASSMAGSIGDPSKRNSLHAALTSNEAALAAAAAAAATTAGASHTNGSAAARSTTEGG